MHFLRHSLKKKVSHCLGSGYCGLDLIEKASTSRWQWCCKTPTHFCYYYFNEKVYVLISYTCLSSACTSNHFIVMLFNSISRWKLTWHCCLYHVQRLALKRLIDISMGVITPLSEQLTKPLPNAMVLVNLKELSSGAYKLLPEGTSCTKKFSELSELSILSSHGLVTIAYTMLTLPLRHTVGFVCSWRWTLWRSGNP